MACTSIQLYYGNRDGAHVVTEKGDIVSRAFKIKEIPWEIDALARLLHYI